MLGAALLLAGDDAYSITNSARFNGTSAYLSRTFSAGNQKTWTWRGLVKRTSIGQWGVLFGVAGGAYYFGFDDTDKIQFSWAGASGYATTSAVYRDPTAWYDICLQFDTTIGGSGSIILSVNGATQTLTLTAGAWPTINTNYTFNSAAAHYVACQTGPANYFGGYISDVVFIDGQALTPSSFGKTDANGVWAPIKYAGTYGTNGCKLEFQSSGALGTDTSGNGNTWTVSGSPVQTVDTPTNNFAVWNALRPSTSALTAGNTMAAGTASGSIPVSQSDTWYWEVKANAVGVTAGLENTSGTTYTQSVTNGTTTGFRYTHSTTTLEYTTNGSTWNTVSSSVAGVAFPYATGASNTVNFGATAFSYTPPTGFKTLCTANVPSTAVTTSGTFTGNANADGPFVWTNGNPATLTINGNAVTFGTHADKLSTGFKLRTSSASYNTSGSNTWTATAGKRFVYSATSINNAQGNP